MRLSRRALFRAGGINANYIHTCPDTGQIAMRPASVSFVTESTVAAARRIEQHFDLMPTELRRQDFKLGDIVVAWIDQANKTQGFIAPRGGNAGIVLDINLARDRIHIPFSGEHLFSARKKLLLLHRNYDDIGVDASRALASIDELFALVRASPDPERFDIGLQGMAFRALLDDKFQDIESDLTDEELGRYFSAITLRAAIQKIDHTHPDALSSELTHMQILAQMGVEGKRSTSGVGGAITDTLSGAMNSFRKDRSPAFEGTRMEASLARITRMRIGLIPMTSLGQDDFQKATDASRAAQITGDWVDALCRDVDLSAPTVRGLPGLPPQPLSRLVKIGGRDALLIPSHSGGSRADGGVILSWPSSERQLAGRYGDRSLLHISREEAPSAAARAKLCDTVASLIRSHEIEYSAGEM